MLYDRPVRELLVDAVEAMPAIFRRNDVVAWFKKHYPSVKQSTVTAHITAATVHSRSRHHYPGGDQHLILQREDRALEKYDPTRHGRWNQHGELIEDKSVRAARATSDPTEACAPSAIASGHAFEIHARRVCSKAWGVPLRSAVVDIVPGCPHQFDLVPADGRVVGDAKWFKNLAAPAAKWSNIAEYVWLLQRLEGVDRRFLVFGQDEEVSKRWLDRFAPLIGDVEFYFLADGGGYSSDCHDRFDERTRPCDPPSFAVGAPELAPCWLSNARRGLTMPAITSRQSDEPAGDRLAGELMSRIRTAVSEGDTIRTLAYGKRNLVTHISPAGLWVQTDRSADRGEGSVLVPAALINRDWQQLRTTGRLRLRDTSHRGSFNCALFSLFPEVETRSTSPVELCVTRMIVRCYNPGRWLRSLLTRWRRPQRQRARLQAPAIGQADDFVELVQMSS